MNCIVQNTYIQSASLTQIKEMGSMFVFLHNLITRKQFQLSEITPLLMKNLSFCFASVITSKYYDNIGKTILNETLVTRVKTDL